MLAVCDVRITPRSSSPVLCTVCVDATIPLKVGVAGKGGIAQNASSPRVVIRSSLYFNTMLPENRCLGGPLRFLIYALVFQ